jgi:hypothetical protein
VAVVVVDRGTRRGTILASDRCVAIPEFRMRPIVSILISAGLLVGVATDAFGQQPDTVALLASQAEALKIFAMLDGVWRGPATVTQANGSQLTFTQTERIGPFLGGSIRLIEGRGYDDAGVVRFNALGVVSYDPQTRAFTLHSHAQGHVGDFAFVPTSDGYRWEIPIGPATLRYIATVKDGELHEIGERVVAGGATQRVFEMRLRRIGDTDWPAGGAVSPK